jgi:hypothetical protein
MPTQLTNTSPGPRAQAAAGFSESIHRSNACISFGRIEQKFVIDERRVAVDSPAHFREAAAGVERTSAGRVVVGVQSERIRRPRPGEVLGGFEAFSAKALTLPVGDDGHREKVNGIGSGGESTGVNGPGLFGSQSQCADDARAFARDEDPRGSHREQNARVGRFGRPRAGTELTGKMPGHRGVQFGERGGEVGGCQFEAESHGGQLLPANVPKQQTIVNLGREIWRAVGGKARTHGWHGDCYAVGSMKSLVCKLATGVCIVMATAAVHGSGTNSANVKVTGPLAGLNESANKIGFKDKLPPRLCNLLWPDYTSTNRCLVKKVSMPGKDEHESKMIMVRMDNRDLVFVRFTEVKTREDAKVRQEYYYRTTPKGDLAMALQVTFLFKVTDTETDLLKDVTAQTFGGPAGNTNAQPITKDIKTQFEAEKNSWLSQQKELKKQEKLIKGTEQ